MELEKELEAIESREDLARFVYSLKKDLESNSSEWENPTLDSYLEALSAWINDMGGYYKNRGLEVPESPTWKHFAEMLMAAKIYE